MEIPEIFGFANRHVEAAVREIAVLDTFLDDLDRLGIYCNGRSLCVVDIPDVRAFDRFAEELFIGRAQLEGAVDCGICVIVAHVVHVINGELHNRIEIITLFGHRLLIGRRRGTGSEEQNRGEERAKERKQM